MDNSEVPRRVYKCTEADGPLSWAHFHRPPESGTGAALLEMTLNKMLSSWKEIAHFFGKGVRTVQRWEKTLNLPIRRPPGAPSNVVLARTSDLEAWMHRGLGKDAMQASATEQDPAELMTELETEVNALIQRTGGNTLVSISEAGASVPRRLQGMIDAMRATDTAAGSEGHHLRKVA